jgi:hypothetical protein
MSWEQLAHSNRLPDCIIANQVALLLEQRFSLLHIVDNQHIVTAMYKGLEITTSIMCNLYHSPLSNSIPVFTATNSAPKTDVLIVACCLENHWINTMVIKTKKNLFAVEHQVA